MIGRFLAFSGWLARPLRSGPLARFGASGVVAGAVVLLLMAALPIVIPQLDPQPEEVVVQAIFEGAVTHPDGWVRLRGQLVPLPEAPVFEDGEYGVLIDSTNPLRSIVTRSDEPLPPAEATMLTGRITAAAVDVESVQAQIPISDLAATAGTAPRVIPDQVVDLDPAPKPERVVLWPLSVLPLLAALTLLVGARVRYPLFRPTTEIDVLVAPLGVGERVPSAYGGRVGPNVRPLDDPGGVLLVVRRGPKGNLLTAQPLADDGGVAPAPVTIGGSWTSGRVGYVHTVRETVPALTIRSELVDATFLFARTTERDRVAALVSVER